MNVINIVTSLKNNNNNDNIFIISLKVLRNKGDPLNVMLKN